MGTMPTLPDLWTILTSPTAQAVGWSLLHLLWQGTLVALALAGALRILRAHSPEVRYGVACVALIGLLILPIITALLVYNGGSASPLGEVTLGMRRAGDRLAPPSFGEQWSAWMVVHVRPVVPWIVLGWTVGVLGSAGRFLVGARQTQRLRRSGTVAPERWQRRLTTLARRLGVDWRVALRRSDRVSVPTVVGWWRPVVLVPLGFLSGRPPAHVEAVLLHELAHVRRHDVLVARLQALCETLLFFHPAAWWISRRVRRAREACCDQVVVREGTKRTAYVRALLGLAEQVCGAAPSPAQVGANDGDFLRRARHILRPTSPPPNGRRLVARVAVVVLLLGTGAGLVHSVSHHNVPPSPARTASTAAASFVLTTDSTGRVGLYPTASPHSDRPSGQALRLDPDRLRRSIRENVDLDRLNRQLREELDAERLWRLLQAHPDRLGRIAGGTLDPRRLERAVRKEVTDSLGRTLRTHVDGEGLDWPVKIRVDLRASHTGHPPDTTQMPRSDDLLAQNGPRSPEADSVLSQAVTESLRDTTLLLGRATTVIRSGGREIVLDADRRSS